MSIRVTYPGTQSFSADLERRGQVTVHVNANVHSERDGGSVERVLALVWSGAPPGARMSQTMAFRGFLRLADGRQSPVRPAAPQTNVQTSGAEVSHPLSPPGPDRLLWVVDALADPARRDPGRVYVTDESYAFSEREGDRLTFYDRPRLMVVDPAHVARQQASGTRATRFVLEGRFHTHLFDGARWIGLVEWGCSWSQRVDSSLAVVTSEPRYARASFHRQRPEDGLTLEELRARMGAWQREERRRSLDSRRP